jgi:hypothetical protein
MAKHHRDQSDSGGRIMQEILERTKALPGLCSTCNHAQACAHRLTNGLVVWFCEEYDDYVPPKVEQPVDPPPAREPIKPYGTDGLMGLCVNCEKRDSCIHAKKVGGVWHCEEYA